VRETRGFTWRGVTFCIHTSLVSLCSSLPSLLGLQFSRYPPPSFSDCARCWDSGWTYVALVEADGNARLLLDFLWHRGGRWSMSSMVVRTSNSNFLKADHHPPVEAHRAISAGSWRWQPQARLEAILDFGSTLDLIHLHTPAASIDGDDPDKSKLLTSSYFVVLFD
jgi:hypothetical protein